MLNQKLQYPKKLPYKKLSYQKLLYSKKLRYKNCYTQRNCEKNNNKWSNFWITNTQKIDICEKKFHKKENTKNIRIVWKKNQTLS